MDSLNTQLRDQSLQNSGGWLGEGVVLSSELLGIWDIFVLSILFILSWVIIRTTSMEISICFGLIYDLGIPLQYVCDKDSANLHKTHLEKYWPVFVIGSVVEGLFYFISHPDLFTLIVCIKTLLCLCLWLRKTPTGGGVQLATTTSTQPSPSKPRVSSTSGKFHIDKATRNKVNDAIKKNEGDAVNREMREKLATKLANAETPEQAMAAMKKYGAEKYIPILGLGSGSGGQSGGTQSPAGRTPPSPAASPLVEQAKRILGSDGLGLTNNLTEIMYNHISTMPPNDAKRLLHDWSAVNQMPGGKGTRKGAAISNMIKPYQEILDAQMYAEADAEEAAKEALRLARAASKAAQ